MHDEVRCGMPSIQTDEMVELINRKQLNDQVLKIRAMIIEFSHVKRIFICTIFTGYQKLCSKWLPQKRSHQDGADLFSYIVTGDK